MKIQETQSVQLPLLGTVNNLEIRVNSFSLFPSSIEVFWKVSGETVSKEGTLTLPRELISAWGTDDTIIQDYVLDQLGLVEEVIVEPTPYIPPTKDITSTEETVEETPTEETTIEETITEEVVEETVVEETPPTE